jgi:hypothetical protein
VLILSLKLQELQLSNMETKLSLRAEIVPSLLVLSFKGGVLVSLGGVFNATTNIFKRQGGGGDEVLKCSLKVNFSPLTALYKSRQEHESS